MATRLVIVGGVAAGTKAASRARRVNPEIEITLYQEEPEVSISECGLPYFLSDMIGARSKLVARTPEEFARNGIEARTRCRVERIDPERKRLSVCDLATSEKLEDAYDRLIIATGAQAVLPSIPGSDLDGVFTLRFLTDADRILGYVKERSPKKAVVVGGGYVGLEAAENLKNRGGMEVSLVQSGDHVAAAFDPGAAEVVEDHLREKGVEVVTGARVEEFEGDGHIRGVRFGDRRLEADIAVVGVGIQPRVDLAETTGMELGASGAIRVDRYMKTNLPEVWAAGDCVESTNLASGKPGWFPLGDTANQMGRVAGTNAATGENTLEFPGVTGTIVFKVFDFGVGKSGLSEREAQNAGFDAASAEITSTSRAAYYPGAERVYLKLIAERSTGRILGAQTVGAGADKLVDVCATAIWGRLSYRDLINLDLAYAPPFGPVLSPVIQAASVLSSVLEK